MPLWTLGCTHLFELVFFSDIYIQKCNGIPGLYSGSIFSFLRNLSYCFPQWLHHLTYAPQSTRVPFPPCPHQHLLFVLFLMIALLTSLRCHFIVVLTAFSWWFMMLSIFSCIYWPFVSFIKISIQTLCPFFNWLYFAVDLYGF